MNEIQRLIHEMCPDGVPMVALQDMCSIITDGAHNSPINVDIGYFMPSVKDMTNNGFNFSNCKKISKADYLSLVNNGCKPLKNDILIAKDGSMLKYVFVVEEEKDIVILSSIAILRPILSLLYPKYLVHYFSDLHIKERIINDYSSKGGGVPRIVLKNFKRIPIPLPPLPIQQRIVEILDKFTSLVSSLDSEIALRQKQYEYYRNKLLSFEEGEEGVEWKKLGDFCSFQNGFAFKSNLFKDYGTPIVRITNITDNFIDLSDIKYFDKSDYRENLSPYKINKGEIKNI